MYKRQVEHMAEKGLLFVDHFSAKAYKGLVVLSLGHEEEGKVTVYQRVVMTPQDLEKLIEALNKVKAEAPTAVEVEKPETAPPTPPAPAAQPVQPAVLICPNCGHKNRPDAKFCTNCGTRLV